MKTTKSVNRAVNHKISAKNRIEEHHFISEELFEQIKKKAHELYEGRGHLPGNDMTDWLEAEKIVLGQQA